MSSLCLGLETCLGDLVLVLKRLVLVKTPGFANVKHIQHQVLTHWHIGSATVHYVASLPVTLFDNIRKLFESVFALRLPSLQLGVYWRDLHAATQSQIWRQTVTGAGVSQV